MSHRAGRPTSEPARTLSTDGRFEIEGVLGQGGMGAVYRARESTLGRQVALKRLSNNAKAKYVALFEREYHTLISIKHPNVVEVLDYGTDSEGPWYTMELLEGGDLARAAPLPWTEVCRILRDVSSALALVHARRLLHRDISARNVWQTPSGRIKLIDFGALCAFGRANDVTGTPPYMAPEALHGQLLDQRTDLYSTGVLGYFLLTGLYPFPARDLAELDELWRHPPKPASQRVRELCRSDLPEPPAELDALIAALLKLEAMARPGNAAELIERLDAIVPPSGNAAGSGVEGSLGKTAFVGRAQVMTALSRALELAATGLGSAAVIEAEPGLGRTRLLTEFALGVRFAGAVALQVDPAPYRGELYGVAQAFALKLLDTLPELSRRLAAPHAAVLGHLSASLREKLDLSPAALAEMPDTPGEARMRIQAALADWFFDVAKERTLVLLADDLHSLDEASAAWLAGLARTANRTRLLVVGTLRADLLDNLERAVQSVRQAATVFLLPALASAEMLEILRSIFGEAARLGRLAETLHRISDGGPAHAIELVEHLVRRGTIAHSDGAWVLPHDLDPTELPQTRSAALAGRLSRLNPDARAIARALSLIEGRIRLEAVKALAPCDAGSTFAALELLVKEGVLSAADGDYTFANDGLRKILEGELDARGRASAHRTLGELMLQADTLSPSERLRAGLHLLLSGEIERGSALACAACRDLSTTHLTEQGICAGSMEVALRLLREHGRPSREQLPVLAALTGAGFYLDRKLALRYGPDTVAAFERAVGLPLARRLRPFLGRRLALLVVLAGAAISIGLRGRRNVDLTFQETMVLLCASVAALTGVYTICIDPKRAAACAQVLEPLSALGDNHVAGLMYEYCVAVAATVSDRLGHAYASWEPLTKRLQGTQAIRDLPDSLRVFFMAGGLYALGIMASWRDDKRALSIADELDALKLKLYEMNADQVRMMYYGNQGNRALFDHYRERVEMHAIQRGTAWQAETWAAAAQLTVYLRSYDGTRMKQCVDQLQRIGAEVPSMAHFVQRGRGFYLLLRDKPKEAELLLEDALQAEPMEVVSWAGWCGTLIRAYNALGEHECARALCQKVLGHLSTEDRKFPAMNLIVEAELALAEARLGNSAAAIRQIDELLAAHAPGQGPLTLGSLHEMGARIALLAGDDPLFERHFAEMERHYRGTKTASLFERGERLVKQRARGAQATDSDMPPTPEQLGEHLHTVLYRIRHGGSGSPLERARWALSQLMSYMPASQGYMYLVSDDGAERIAELVDASSALGDDPETQSAMRENLHRLDSWVSQRMSARAGSVTMTAATQDMAALMTINQIELFGRSYRLVFLQAIEGGKEALVGALVIPTEVVESIPHSVLEAVAGRLKTLTEERATEPPPLHAA